MIKPTLEYEISCWKKGFDCVIGVDEVGRGALAGPVVAGATALRVSGIEYLVSSAVFRECSGIIDVLSSHKNNLYALGDTGKHTKYSISMKVCSKNILNTKYKILNTILQLGIDDSKKLTAKRRRELAKEIEKYFYTGIGEASVVEINKLGIVKATQRAMRRAVRNLEFRIKNLELSRKKDNNSFFLLLDAFNVKYIPRVGLKHQQAVVGGDGKCISIAAASIVAKVYRDNLMRKLASLYSRYKWDENKGYATDYHRKMLAKYGVTKLHRTMFVDSLSIFEKF